MATIQIEVQTQAEQLLSSIGTIPASMKTNYQRVGYVLSILRSNADEAIANGAKSLYDGSISEMSKSRKTSTPEAVIAKVLERAQAFQPFPEWVKSLEPLSLPLDLFPDDDPPPTTPASAPVPQYGTEADFERFCIAGTFWRQFDQALPHILNHWDALCANWADEAEGVSDDMVGWMEEEAAEWQGNLVA